MNGRLLVTAVSLAVATLSPTPAAGQFSPREAATGFLQAWNARLWTETARFLDLDSFDRFRRDFITRARRQPEEGPQPSVEELLRRNPDMPREAAEYQIRMMREQQRRFADPTPYEFARVASATALRALTSDEAAARWLESRDPRWQVRMQYEQAGCPAPTDLNDIPLPRRRLIGVVADGDSTTDALFKENRGDDKAPAWVGDDVSIMELALRRGRWVVVPRADLVPEIGSVDVSDCRK